MKTPHVLTLAAVIVFGLVILPALIIFGPEKSRTTVIVNVPANTCIQQEEADTTFRYTVYALDGKGRQAGITGITVVPCYAADVVVEDTFLTAALGNAKEQVYLGSEKGELRTVADVESRVTEFLASYVDIFPRYQGKIRFISVKVSTFIPVDAR